MNFMSQAAPFISFIPVIGAAISKDKPEDYFVNVPIRLLQERGCTDFMILYSVAGKKKFSPRLGGSLKFDEYKYAVCGVPFSEKWKLRIKRNRARELALHRDLGINGQYICIHRNGSGGYGIDVEVPEEWSNNYQIIEIGEKTDNPFDWIFTLENASKLLLIDSCFANLVEQLNLKVEKHLILRSPVPMTPVYKNAWNFL